MTEINERLIGRLAAVLASVRDTEPLAMRLCEASRQMLSADGAALILRASDNSTAIVCSTDDLSTDLVDVQEVVHQGPTIEAFQGGQTEIAEFGADDDRRWSLMHEHGQRLGFDGTLIAVPLRPHDHVIGVLSAHRGTPEIESDRATGRFLEVAIGTALLQHPQFGHEDAEPHDLWPSRSQINQATGMVVSQASVRPEDALALLRGQAFVNQISLLDVAQQIIQRQINFQHFTIEGD